MPAGAPVRQSGAAPAEVASVGELVREMHMKDAEIEHENQQLPPGTIGCRNGGMSAYRSGFWLVVCGDGAQSSATLSQPRVLRP